MQRAEPTREQDLPDAISEEAALSPYKTFEWQSLSPAERLARAWALRDRLVDPEAVHDQKLFPAP